MIRSVESLPPVTVGLPIPSDPETLAKHTRRHEQFVRNVQWFEQHLADIREHHLGRYVCVIGQEVFAGDTPQDVMAAGHAVHPDERGAGYVTYIHPQPGVLIYAVRG